MSTPPRIVVIHGLDHARAAAAAAAALGVVVRLRSAPGGGGYAGAAWFRELAQIAGAEFPDAVIEAALDCGDTPGHALAALRAGLKLVRFTGPKRTAAKIGQIAAEHGAAMDIAKGRVLDLADEPDPEAACLAWLGKAG